MATYLTRAIGGFELDPPDTDYQRGFLEALKVVQNESGYREIYDELEACRQALKRIEQEPRTPTKMRDIAGARAHYAEIALAKARGETVSA